MRRIALLLWMLFGAAPAAHAAEDPLATWLPAERMAQEAYEKALNAVPAPKRLRAWHDLFCAEPHPAGGDGDQRTIQKMIDAFKAMGLETERHDFFPYLPRFVRARVAVVWGDQVLELPTREKLLAGDPSIAKEVPPAWNAYSGSGKAVGRVVYANYGRKEDFETLKKLGISCKGAVVIARYGGNYRGYKARYAEAAGAAGLVIYTDPADSGWGRGLAYPQGGYADGAYIQRGSIKTLPYAGDPLTPFEPATEDAKRLDPEDRRPSQDPGPAPGVGRGERDPLGA